MMQKEHGNGPARQPLQGQQGLEHFAGFILRLHQITGVNTEALDRSMVHLAGRRREGFQFATGRLTGRWKNGWERKSSSTYKYTDVPIPEGRSAVDFDPRNALSPRKRGWNKRLKFN
jgi:hypothetical protein